MCFFLIEHCNAAFIVHLLTVTKTAFFLNVLIEHQFLQDVFIEQ